MLINWIKPIWIKPKHNAFTDLCVFQGKLYCCFREATNHISGDGIIRILTLTSEGEIQHENVLRLPEADLRDPKLSVADDEKLLLLAYARHPDKNNVTRFSQPMTWFSGDGISWSNAKPIGDQNWWLWRIKWHAGLAHGFAYNRRQQRLKFYSGLPRRTFQLVQDEALSQEKHGLGYPNESDLIFLEDHSCVSLIRRDADSCSAQMGTAKPPYKQWKWQDLGEYIGGPVMLKIDENTVLVAGRLWREQGPKTALWCLDMKKAKLTLLNILPSGGDCSYPGLLKHENHIYLSYYSSHLNQNSCIYLAKINFPGSNEVE